MKSDYADSSRPTNVRYLLVVATCLVAFFMYIDRACVSQMKKDIQTDLSVSDAEMDWVFSAFFWSYALAQVPSGFLGKRFGLRHSLAVMLFTWSLCTAVCGLVTGLYSLLVARLAVGLAEAGAYPTAAALVKGWFPVRERGRGSGLVALGGRLGWALSQHLTPRLAAVAYGWRGVLVIFGLVGMVWSFVFWFIARDRPREHPWSNAAEDERTGPPDPPPAADEWPLADLATSRNMWLFGLVQFGVNVGWAFLITKLPAMLQERYGATDDQKGDIAALPAWASCVGMFLGGFIGDAMVRRYGLRWGRRLPIATMLFVAGLAYLLCPTLDTPWSVAVALAVMAVSVDIGVPSIWAFAQDVGGRHVGAALGWGNMFGNLGAAVSPLALGAIQRAYGWDAMFLTCAGCFAVAGVAALNLDATRPVLRPAPEARGP